jgi:nucleotide-binding universal stress UspA family protein
LSFDAPADPGEHIALLVDVTPALTVLPMAKSNVRFDRILCAVTFAQSSPRVAAWAASLAASYEGEVRLFHALPGADQHATATTEVDSERVLQRLFRLSQQLPGRPRVSAAVTEGDAAAEISRHARMVQADLIAVGMHSQDGRVSPLVARLAVDAPCPVLVVDEAAAAPVEGAAVNEIVVAVNFLPASLAATDYAVALAHMAGARVTGVHVLTQDGVGLEAPGPSVEESRRRVEHRFRRLLQAAVNESSGSPSDWSAVVISGQPCVEIVRIARTRDAGVIVMGIDAGPASHKEFGETAGCVMQFARKTVLLVPESVGALP